MGGHYDTGLMRTGAPTRRAKRRGRTRAQACAAASEPPAPAKVRIRGPAVLVLGPDLGAVSGVSAHVQALLGSPLAEEFALIHYRVGSEGRSESRSGRCLRLLAGPFALARAIRKHRAAIVHLNTSLNARAFWRDLGHLFAAKLCGARTLYQIHGGKLPQRFCGGNRLLDRLLRLTLMLPDRIVVLAESELEAYRAFVPAQRTAAIPNGVNWRRYALPARAARAAAAPLRLVYLGRLAKDKGIYELLHGVAGARARGCDARLTIAGDGPEGEGLRRTAAELGVTDRIVFSPAVFGAAKARLLREADVFVLPSYAEGLPCALLEAMAAGCAVIATRVGAIPDVVAEHVHGLFVPPYDGAAIADVVIRLNESPQDVARMGAASRDRVRWEYSLERLAADFRASYSALCPVGRMPARIGDA